MKNNAFSAVICAVNSKFIHTSLAPWCLVAGVQKWGENGVCASVLETTINANKNELLEKLKVTAPWVVAFSCYIWNINYIKDIIPQVKKLLPDAKIVLGGPEVSYNPQQCMGDIPFADYILCGEGEQPFAQLLNYLAGKNNDLNSINGLCHRQNMHQEIVPNISTQQPPSPYTEEYFKALNGRIAYLETSRGCPYSCAFCLSGRCGNVRFFDIETAKKEMLLLANSGTQTVKLVDRTFNCNKDRAKQLWQFVIDNYGNKIPNGVCFHFEIAGDILDDESIKILRSAPTAAIQLEIGMQSFYEPTLQEINRKTNTDILQKNIKALLEKGNIHIHIDLIAGLPFEDFNTFKRSFNIGYGLKSQMLQLGFLKILHGASLEKTAANYGIVYSQNPPYEIIENNYLSKNELADLHLLEDALERFANSGRFSHTLDYLETEGIFTAQPNDSNSLSAFEFYLALGKATKTMAGTSLDEYTSMLYQHLSTVDGVDTVKLRDALALDRLCTNSTGRLPKCLQIKDDNLKRVVSMLAKNPNTAQPASTRRGVAVIYSKKNLVAWVDYVDSLRNPLTKKWDINYLEFKSEDL